jgi:hypothetical protein
MKRFLAISLTVGMVGSLPASAFGATPSAGCDFLNHPSWDSAYTIGLADAELNAGETVTIQASLATSGSPTVLRLYADLGEVAADGFPGVLVWTAPSPGTYFIYWESIGGNVEWGVSCGEDADPPVADEDGDGVLDADDHCPGTTLNDPPGDPTRNRFFADESGAFVDGQGTVSGLTLANTHGCDEDQIIEAWDLGRGHQRFGIPIGVLRDWIGLR